MCLLIGIDQKYITIVITMYLWCARNWLRVKIAVFMTCFCYLAVLHLKRPV